MASRKPLLLKLKGATRSVHVGSSGTMLSSGRVLYLHGVKKAQNSDDELEPPVVKKKFEEPPQKISRRGKSPARRAPKSRSIGIPRKLEAPLRARGSVAGYIDARSTPTRNRGLEDTNTECITIDCGLPSSVKWFPFCCKCCKTFTENPQLYHTDFHLRHGHQCFGGAVLKRGWKKAVG